MNMTKKVLSALIGVSLMFCMFLSAGAEEVCDTCASEECTCSVIDEEDNGWGWIAPLNIFPFLDEPD